LNSLAVASGFRGIEGMGVGVGTGVGVGEGDGVGVGGGGGGGGLEQPASTSPANNNPAPRLFKTLLRNPGRLSGVRDECGIHIGRDVQHLVIA